MEKFKYEIPTLKRKKDAINYIKEHIEVGSDINGSGGLDRYINDYEGWLKKLEQDYNRIPNEEKVPARTFFLVRVSDDKIIGMANIRTVLNKRLEKFGGNIGYGIRPSERGKGYNKINLYLALKICKEYGIKIAKLDADLDNPASWKTMEALGGIRIKQYNCEVVDYEINVEESLANYKKIYGEKVEYEIFKEFSKSNEKGIIFTGCFDFENDFKEEKAETDKWMGLFDETYTIELETTLEERLRRNKTANRLEHKASKRDLEWSENDIYKSLKKHRLNSKPGEGEKVFENFYKIDNTNISAKDAAKMIKEKFDL